MKNKIIYSLIITLILGYSYQVQARDYYKIIPASPTTFCTNTYPTVYQQMQPFQIMEVDQIGNNKGFEAGQNNASFILSLTGTFEFNTGAPGNITVTGSEVTIDSFSFLSVTQIVVYITTTTNVQFNTITFSNFQIRATGGTSGVIRRTGGTFLVDISTSKPTLAQTFGSLSVQSPFVYSSCNVSHPLTTLDSIPQYTINNQMLKIKITGNGACGPRQLSQFTFSTNGKNGTGTDSTWNIAKAVVYMTDNSSVFSSARKFGEFFHNDTTYFGIADTTFVINCTAAGGYIDLMNGDNYFWLCYNVPGDAYTEPASNKLDASLKSFVLNGNTITSITTPSPVGHRVVKPAKFYYSRKSGYWFGSSQVKDIWSIVDNGPTCNCFPNGGGVVVINTGHSIVLDKFSLVDAVEVLDGAYFDGQSANTDIIINSALKTYGTGYFKFMGNFDVIGDLIMTGTGISEFHKRGRVYGNVYIGGGTTLLNSSSSTFDFRIGGNLTVHGLLENAGGYILNVFMFGPNATIDGRGIIHAEQFTIENGYKKVVPDADLLFDSRFLIQGPVTYIENYGRVEIRDNMNGTHSDSRWINKSNSVLSYGGLANMFLTNGYLDAREDYNTVIYSRNTAQQNSNDQNIVLPKDSIYYHLVLDGVGNKTMLQNTHLHGDFTTNTAFVHNNKTMVVDGVVMQYFKGTVSPTMWNLTMNNAAVSGGLTLQLPVFYSGKLTLNNGKIFTTMTNILTANDNATATSGKINSFVHGPMKKLGNDAFVYPVGKNTVWARIGISTPLNLLASFTAEYFLQPAYVDTIHLDPSLHTVSKVEYWNLYRNVGADNLMVSLYWEDVGRSGINNSDSLVVAGWDGSLWQNRQQSAIAFGSAGNITSSLVTYFDSFTFGSKGDLTNPLPITLLDFDAQLAGEAVNINWITQSETNNDYFTVEKSRDAIIFEIAAIEDGAGNSNQTLHYNTIDNSPYTGISYYRLRQTDFDGKYSYSDIVAVLNNRLTTYDLTVFPNPFISSVNISFKGVSDENSAEFYIYNIWGVEVMHKHILSQLTSLETSKLDAGIYQYNLILGDKTYFSGKLVKQ